MIMADRDTLLKSIVATTLDYWQAPTTAHVDQWVGQFDATVQVPILCEMDHVLNKTYFSKVMVKNFLDALTTNKNLAGDDPCSFWKNVKFLNIQNGGDSQSDMLQLLSNALKKNCGFTVEQCGMMPNAVVYLDDGVFTGNRLGWDIENWINDETPDKIVLYIITIALHKAGWTYAAGKIKRAAEKAGKTIQIKRWSAIKLENGVSDKDVSDVLWPTSIPSHADTKAHVAKMKYSPKLRNPGQVGGGGIFSSDTGRQLLERVFLEAGATLLGNSSHFADSQRPLGFSKLETLGFGSLIVTYRNCPNNAPLALWADKPWYPLFRRKIN